MKPTWMLERELMKEEERMQSQIMRSWVTSALRNATIISIFAFIGFAILFIEYNIFIDLQFILFMLSGLLFLIGGMVGTMKTSVSINVLINRLTGANLRTSGEVHSLGTQSMVTYALTAILLSIYSVLVFYLWSPIMQLLSLFI